MSKFVFFSIPAYGHTNPTIEVVRRLSQRGHTVHYYSFEPFREQIEGAGAQFIPCDAYLPPLPKDFDRRAKYDFSSLIGMTTHVTLDMESSVCQELAGFQPDCIIADSMCLWGKLYARKLNIPMICSTTSFAFNEHTAKMMKPGLCEMWYTMGGIPKINKYMQQLRQRGYEIENLQQLIQNDNYTETIVFTSRTFQPQSETFGNKYTFVGPSVADCPAETSYKDRPLIYISLGTVIKDIDFFRSCIKALQDSPYDVVMSVGSEENAALLQAAPSQFQIKARVPQLQVLQNADVFITHAGMNSVNESIYFEVPMVLFPQHSEQKAVAQRTQEVGAGIILKRARPDAIKAAVEQVFSNKQQYQEQVHRIAESFRASGGPEKAADRIEELIHSK